MRFAAEAVSISVPPSSDAPRSRVRRSVQTRQKLTSHTIPIPDTPNTLAKRVLNFRVKLHLGSPHVPIRAGGDDVAGVVDLQCEGAEPGYPGTGVGGGD